jgi:hypothetical protein
MGLKPSEFWALTYAEFCAMTKGYVEEKRERGNDLMTSAWFTAYFTRKNPMPPLKDFIQSDKAESKPNKPQTPEQMLAMARILNAAYGGDVVEA